MEWLIIVLAVGGSGFVGRRLVLRRALRAEANEELEGVRRLAEEDVTVLGEQLRRLDAAVEGRALDDAARVDYQTALDAYESAGRLVPRLRTTDEISKVTDTLSTGRYALACVQARVEGRPVPELRVPCFFNPQHGPSVGDVMWTAPGRGTRKVPACAQDAARVAAFEEPEVRKVTIGSRRIAYWQAGAAFQPYAEGYFPSAALITWAFVPIADGGGFGGLGGYDGGGWGGGGFDGGGGGFDGGGGGGGFDGGGSGGGSN